MEPSTTMKLTENEIPIGVEFVVYEIYFSNKRDEMYFCSYAPKLLFSILSLSAASLLVERYTEEDGTRIHASRCRTNKKIFSKINRGKEKNLGLGSVTYYCETRVERCGDIQNVRKNILLLLFLKKKKKEIRKSYVI